jgi:hypothetical protein
MLTLQREWTGHRSRSVRRPLYLCSFCGNKRRREAVLFTRQMCRSCYSVRAEKERRAALAMAARLPRTYPLSTIALIGGIAFSLLALLGAIGSAPLPMWVSYVLMTPLIVLGILTFYGIAAGQSAVLIVTVERRPGCVDYDCRQRPRRIEQLPSGKTRWQCSAGHSFYMGRLGMCSRYARWAW